MAAYGGFDDPGPAAEPEGGGRTALHTDAGLDELRSALLAALEQRGTLEEMRARVRARVARSPRLVRRGAGYATERRVTVTVIGAHRAY